jgi:hypothetical protein
MDKVVLLTELRVLANDVPDFASYAPTSRLHLAWVGRTHALLARWNRLEAIGFSSAADFLPFEITRANNVAKMLGILHRAIADLELEVPTLQNQAFGPGAVYDFLKSLRDLLGSATTSIFVVDPYLDEGIFDAYLSVVPAEVSVRLLVREYAAALKPAVAKFVSQKKMPVEVRASKAIHDRVVFIDGRSCWVLGASIKDAAKAKPTYLAPLAADAVALKLADYEKIWTSATPI